MCQTACLSPLLLRLLSVLMCWLLPVLAPLSVTWYSLSALPAERINTDRRWSCINPVLILHNQGGRKFSLHAAFLFSYSEIKQTGNLLAQRTFPLTSKLLLTILWKGENDHSHCSTNFYFKLTQGTLNLPNPTFSDSGLTFQFQNFHIPTLIP